MNIIETTRKRARIYSAFAEALAGSGFESFDAWSRALGMNPGAFSKICRGIQRPNIETAILIAKTGKTTVEQLWGHEVPAIAEPEIEQEGAE